MERALVFQYSERFGFGRVRPGGGEGIGLFEDFIDGDGGRAVEDEILRNGGIADGEIAPDPVSYTPLDVYKRQCLRLPSVADAADGLDAVAIGAELLPERPDVHVDGARLAAVVRAPDLLHQLLARPGDAGMRQKELQ